VTSRASGSCALDGVMMLDSEGFECDRWPTSTTSYTRDLLTPRRPCRLCRDLFDMSTMWTMWTIGTIRTIGWFAQYSHERRSPRFRVFGIWTNLTYGKLQGLAHGAFRVICHSPSPEPHVSQG
jgi:hypothetical protein